MTVLEEALQQSPKWVHLLIRDILDTLVFPVIVKIGQGVDEYRFDWSRFCHVATIVPYETPEETVYSYIEILERAWACEYVHPSIAFFAFEEETPPALIQAVRLELMMGSSWVLSRLTQERFPEILKVHRAETLQEYQDVILNWDKFFEVDERALNELTTMMAYLLAWLRRYAKDLRVTIPDYVPHQDTDPLMEYPDLPRHGIFRDMSPEEDEAVDRLIDIQVSHIPDKAEIFLGFKGPWDVQGFLQLTNQLLEVSRKKYRVQLIDEAPEGMETLKIIPA